MKKDVVVPAIGESISTGIIRFWFKNNGEFVKEEEDLFELESEKATITVPSPFSGTLEIKVDVDVEVNVGDVVATIDTDAGEKPAKKPVEEKKASETKKEESGKEKIHEPVKEKVEAIIEPPKKETGEKRTRVPMTGIRKVIARRLVESRQNSAHLTTFNEINMREVLDTRAEFKELFEKKHGTKLGLMSFFVKASVQALKEFPDVNAIIEGEEIVYNNYHNIGVAVSTNEGLVVPVLRNTDSLSLAAIEKEIARLAQLARENKIMPDDFAGGTFSITNGGVFGSLLSTPIPNYPQTAILGMHTIQKRPVAINDQVSIEPMMYVALTYDHRLIDGKTAVKFLIAIKNYVETPERLLLEI